MLTYDRRIIRTNFTVWNRDIQDLYSAGAGRGGRNYTVSFFKETTERIGWGGVELPVFDGGL